MARVDLLPNGQMAYSSKRQSHLTVPWKHGLLKNRALQASTRLQFRRIANWNTMTALKDCVTAKCFV